MAKKFKDYYDEKCAKIIAEKILTINQKNKYKFDSLSFINFIKKEIPQKNFFERQDIFVLAFEKFLGNNYKKNIEIFTKILGPELSQSKGMFIHGWWLWPIGRYVEKYGHFDPDVSIKFIYELTKRFTGEFAIRPVLQKFPRKTMKIMLVWSKDKNVHVRRLSSEGIRPRLPWAKKTNVSIENFDLYKKILNNLNKDSEKFVQKSVANNLNDLMKENKKLALEIINDWKKSSANLSKETLWIIKHGTRSLR